VPPWLKTGTVILTICIAMPMWAVVVIVELVRGQPVSTDLMAIPLGLLAAAGIASKGNGYLINIRRKRDDEGDKP
jgi:hypothetical protein